ncbi:PepSY-associated TM helix domain-containing protein [Brevibacillus sp. SYSU BS000544]|uniref:PepSY-associated TM helix domain-containing protein n=1 Tax=Brevibacillus sp. SYSU BS000544 TaxID=3416443 RepID=UPI003CE47C33
MKISRQLHLWIGLICSVLILIESITGLLLAEPWLIGAERREGMRHPQAVMETRTISDQPASAEMVQTEPTGNETTQAQPPTNRVGEQAVIEGEGRIEQGGLMMVVRQLHEGRIGSMNAIWLVDLSAIAMIFLTITGITLSIKTLRAQSIRRKKQNGYDRFV